MFFTPGHVWHFWGICQKPTIAAIVWRNKRLLLSYVFVYPTDTTFYVCVFRGSLKPDASHMLVIDVDLNVGKIQEVKFLWNKHVINLFRPKLGASHITVQSGEDGTECVSFILSKSYFLYLPIDLSVHTYIHTNAYPPVLYPSTHPLSHPFLSIHLTTYLSTYPSIQPAIQPFIYPTIHLNSPPIHLIYSEKSNIVFLKPSSTWQDQDISCKAEIRETGK